MTDCEQFERLISDRLDSELSSDQEKTLHNHLATCHSCSEFLANATRQREFLRALPEIKTSIHDATAAPSRWWRRRLAVPVPIAAALAIIAVSGWLPALRLPERQVAATANTAPVVRSVEIIQVQAAQAVMVEDDNSAKKRDEVL